MVFGTQLHRGRWEADAEAFAWSVVSGLSFRDNESVRLHEAPDGSVWIGRGDDLLRHDPSLNAAPGAAPPVLIRRVIAGADERVVWGARSGEGAVLSLPYDRNDPLIQFAAPNFNAESPPMYRTRLLGRDADWSDWTRRSAVDFVGLRENTYRLEVQARTVDGIVSEPSRLTVVVAPPWYRTGWAYLAYLLTLAGLVAAVWQYRVAVRRRRAAEEKTSKTAEELQAEQQLNQSLTRANERLREINRMKEFFIANTSHELRTPLTNIIGFARVLQDDVSDGLAPHLQVIENNGYRLLYTLNAILDLAGLRAGTMEPVLEWADIRTPVRSVAQEMKGDAASKSLVLETQIPDRPVFAYLDAHMLERIVRHLVDNAVKFTAEGSIHIRVWESDDRVGITVRDTGVGIDPSFVPDLFVGFEQESQGMARSYEGSGIGLAVTGQFVDVLDGRIKVASTKGEGSTFTVTFPRRGPGR
jgi:signal transduction histidine kinase